MTKTSMVLGNKEIIRELFEESLNKRDMQFLRDHISEDFTGINGKKGAAGFEEPISGLIKAFPDMQWKIEELVCEGNKVVAAWNWQGMHTGQFQHIKPTGKKISNSGMAVFELRDGKIISSRVLTDRLGFWQELEVLPTDLTLLGNKKFN